MNWLEQIQPGHEIIVKNYRGLKIRVVTKVTDNRIFCGDAEYSRLIGSRYNYNALSGEYIVPSTPALFAMLKKKHDKSQLLKRIANCKLSNIDYSQLLQVAEILGV